jgi:hypothetical protein
MPVRRRHDRRAERAEFAVTAALIEAFREYIASESIDDWTEHWHLHDLLEEAGAPLLPLIPPCCWHPDLVGVDWSVVPWAVAIHRRLVSTRTT